MAKNQRVWTSEEEQILRDKYQEMGYNIIGLFPYRSKVSVIRKVENLGLKLAEKPRPIIDHEKALTRLEFKIEDLTYELISLVLFGDIHIGAPNDTCNLAYAKKMVRNILNDKKAGYAIGMGDYLDNIKAVWQGGRGPTPFETTMSPQKQYEVSLDLLKPLAEAGRLIGLHEGNHDAWTRQTSGIDVARNLARELKVPLLGPGCTTRIIVGKQVYVLYTFHGTGSSKLPGGKLNALMNAVRAIGIDREIL